MRYLDGSIFNQRHRRIGDVPWGQAIFFQQRLIQRLDQLRLGWHTGMPIVLIFHKAHPFTFDRIGDRSVHESGPLTGPPPA